MYIGLHVNYPLFLSDFSENEISVQIFEKSSHIKLYENSSSGSRVVTCGQTDGRTDKHDEVDRRFSQFCERA